MLLQIFQNVWSMFQMMTSLESAATNAEVAQIYSVGRNALKSQLGSMKSVDEVEDLVDEIKELIEEVSCCLNKLFIWYGLF